MTDTATNGAANGFDARLSDIGTALVLLARLPVPRKAQDHRRASQAVWAYPVAGAIIGLIAGVLLWLLGVIGLPPGPAAAIALGAMAVMTGALHEDGLADCADGLGGGKSREDCLEIMRDSRIGAYGVVALGISLVARWSALALLAMSAPIVGLIVAACVSRMPMVLVMAGMRPARMDGLAASVGRPDALQAAMAFSLALLVALIFTGFWGFVIVLAALAAALPLIFWASRLIDGYSGDVLGGIEQSAEILTLALLATILV